MTISQSPNRPARLLARVNLEKVRRDDWILAGVALLLVIDLLALPWFDVSVGPISVTSTATGAPDGWLGVLAVLAAIALIADLALERLAPEAEIPAIQGNRTMTRLVLAGVTALFVLLKFLFHIHFSLFGFGFWAAVVLTIALVAVAARAHRDGHWWPRIQSSRRGRPERRRRRPDRLGLVS